MIPSYEGGKFPLTTYLASQVREILADPKRWAKLPTQVCEWLQYQQQRSLLPGPSELLVETFPRSDKFYMVAYTFEGRLAHQTLGMLLTRRLERARARPLGFSATDYSLAVWGLRDLGVLFEQGKPSLAALFDEDMLGDDLEAWLADSYLLKRTFRNCAIISGLIERRHPGEEKTGRQVTVSTDLVYDVLRSHEPDHILLQATRADAATGLLDIQRLGEMLLRVKGRIVHQRLERVSPLAVPIMLEISKEPVFGEAQTDILADAAEALIREAMGEAPLEPLAACKLAAPRPRREPEHERPAWLRRGSRSPARRPCSTRPARCGCRQAARSWSPTCIWRRARPSPGGHAAAALRHAARRCARSRISWRGATRGASSASATVFTTRGGFGAACGGRPRARSPRCSAGGSGSGSAATTIRELPAGARRRHRRRARVRRSHFPPRADSGEARGEIAGHLHSRRKVARPAAASVRRRAFATDGMRMVLPAFGVLTRRARTCSTAPSSRSSTAGMLRAS